MADAADNQRPALAEHTSALRIAIDELPARIAAPREERAATALGELAAAEGAACRFDCDCRIGLVCVDGMCAEKD
jgi:hypothetical protein